jgi:hypothetical protein
MATHSKVLGNELADRVAKIICIFKKGDFLLPENYRPISSSDAFYKLYAELVLNRIQQQVDQHLRQTQYGFRAARSPVILYT